MLKAAAWRLAQLLRSRPAIVLSMEDAALREQIAVRYGMRGHGAERDRARQLLKKIVRLRPEA